MIYKRTTAFILTSISFWYSNTTLAAGGEDDHDSTSIKIIVALIAGILGLVTALCSTFIANKHAKKILDLQAQVDLQNEKENNSFKFLLSYENDKVSQYLLSLRAYAATVQKLKDGVRDIMAHFNNTLEADRIEQVTVMRKKIIEEYANNVYNFSETDKDKIAHEIKSQFVEIFNTIESNALDTKIKVAELVDDISKSQPILTEAISAEIDKIIKKFR